jgi:O-antigen ligase
VGLKADSPHQQYFLWWVEGGTIALLCLLGIFGAIYKDALTLEEPARHALITVLAVLCVISLMNSPLEGAGIAEYFCFVIAALLCVGTKPLQPLLERQDSGKSRDTND